MRHPPILLINILLEMRRLNVRTKSLKTWFCRNTWEVSRVYRLCCNFKVNILLWCSVWFQCRHAGKQTFHQLSSHITWLLYLWSFSTFHLTFHYSMRFSTLDMHLIFPDTICLSKHCYLQYYWSLTTLATKRCLMWLRSRNEFTAQIRNIKT